MTMNKAIPLLLTVLLTCMQADAQPALDQATLDLALEPPALNTNPGPEYAAANRPGPRLSRDEGSDVADESAGGPIRPPPHRRRVRRRWPSRT